MIPGAILMPRSRARALEQAIRSAAWLAAAAVEAEHATGYHRRILVGVLRDAAHQLAAVLGPLGVLEPYQIEHGLRLPEVLRVEDVGTTGCGDEFGAVSRGTLSLAARTPAAQSA